MKDSINLVNQMALESISGMMEANIKDILKTG